MADACNDGDSALRLKMFHTDGPPQQNTSENICHFGLRGSRRVHRLSGSYPGSKQLNFSPNQFVSRGVLCTRTEETSEETWCASVAARVSVWLVSGGLSSCT